MNLLTELEGFKFVTTLVLKFKKIESDDETKYSTFYSSTKADTIINESDIDGALESICSTIIPNKQNSLGKGWGWIVDSVVDHNIIILKYKPLSDSSYIKLPKELEHPAKGSINIQNIIDNECIQWCLVRYLHPADHHPAWIRKVEKSLINIQNINHDECIKWCFVRHLHPADHHPAKTRKVEFLLSKLEILAILEKRIVSH